MLVNSPDVYEAHTRAELMKKYETEPAAMADDLEEVLEGFFEENVDVQA